MSSNSGSSVKTNLSYKSVEDVRNIFSSLDVETIFIKSLSEHQDNSKNQIYLGTTLESVINIFPAKVSYRSGSTSRKKRRSKAGQPKLEAALNFHWLDRDGNLHRAKHTKIVDYFQYPEIRLSGFMRGCKKAPDSLRRDRQSNYGNRILALGADRNGRVIGLVLTEVEDPLVSQFPLLPEFDAVPIFRVLLTTGTVGAKPDELLIRDLRKIISDGWHKSVRLKPKMTTPEPFRGNQGAGYTLEACLGIASNSSKKPDKYGFEVKTYSSKVSLMTPTGDIGFRGDNGFEKFMSRYGRPRKTGTKRGLVFNGKYSIGMKVNKYGFKMLLDGFDFAEEKVVGKLEVNIVDQKTEKAISGWSIEKLANSWVEKHAAAAYLAYESKDLPNETQHGKAYRYKPTVLIGEGTSIQRLLVGIAKGYVYYDPGDEIPETGKSTERPQWRVNANKLKEMMEVLYEKVKIVSLE